MKVVPPGGFASLIKRCDQNLIAAVQEKCSERERVRIYKEVVQNNITLVWTIFTEEKVHMKVTQMNGKSQNFGFVPLGMWEQGEDQQRQVKTDSELLILVSLLIFASCHIALMIRGCAATTIKLLHFFPIKANKEYLPSSWSIIVSISFLFVLPLPFQFISLALSFLIPTSAPTFYLTDKVLSSCQSTVTPSRHW